MREVLLLKKKKKKEKKKEKKKGVSLGWRRIEHGGAWFLKVLLKWQKKGDMFFL